MSETPEVNHTWAVRVHGRVQGIGFRDACVRQARVLGLTGWVRNRIDGSVEAVLQGRSAPLAQMRNWLEGGMPTATIERVDVDTLMPGPAHYDRFERRPTPLD